MTRNEFGGIWTRIKLEILEKYLGAYTIALSQQRFTLHYADAFAGTGFHDIRANEEQSTIIPEESLKGSAKIALDVGRFHHYHFNDLNPRHVEALEAIKSENPEKSITVTRQDANDFIRQFCAGLGRFDRAVLFIDPFSTQLEWGSLECASRTAGVDLWLLFPISALARTATKKESALPASWEKTISRLLGMQPKEWRPHLYRQAERAPIEDMFGGAQQDDPERIDFLGLQDFVTERLAERFSFTSQPIRLKDRGRTLFLLYFAMSSKSDAAKKLARRIVAGVIKKAEQQ